MSPGDERSRPAANGPASETLDYDNVNGSPAGDISVRDVLLAEIRALGADALYPASLGWRLGRLDAEDIAKQRIADAGRDVIANPAWQRTVRQPRWTELQRRRGECVRKHRVDQCTCPTLDRVS